MSTKFKELGLQDEVAHALGELGITDPTEIQQKVIPPIKEGRDVIGVSKTGSGKTIAFGTPILGRLKPGQAIQALVIVPVRELAEQVGRELRKFSKNLRLKVAIVYGGVSLGPQTEQLRSSEIVVGTPGRLLDHINRGSINLSHVQVVVLDEADKMATMGFIEDVQEILKETPSTRQTLLFGATISEDIARLRDHYMRSPVTIRAEHHVDQKLLDQYYYDVDMREKFSLLVHLLRKEKPTLAIVFCASRRTSELVARNLHQHQVHSHCIHGGLSQNRRLRVLEDFHRGQPEILVATAVAARGLDIKHISHIFNYDVPKNSEEYIHQIGRTARAGETGKAITLLSHNDYPLFTAILKRYPIHVTKLPKEDFPHLVFDAGRRGHYQQNRFQGHRQKTRPYAHRRR